MAVPHWLARGHLGCCSWSLWSLGQALYPFAVCLKGNHERTPSMLRPPYQMPFAALGKGCRTESLEKLAFQGTPLRLGCAIFLAKSGGNYGGCCKPLKPQKPSRDLYIIHLNIATCKWWCPTLFIYIYILYRKNKQKKHLSTGGKMSFFFQDPCLGLFGSWEPRNSEGEPPA